jgi:ERCC4-type nuclease
MSESLVYDLVFDSHETDVKSSFESENLQKECGSIPFTVEQLDVGDFIFRSPLDGKVQCLVERKTPSDYASSITDKRLKNQALRIVQLKKDNPEIIIIYLIEGQHPSKDYRYRNGITRDRLYSSMINKVLRDNFIIYHSNNHDDTALWLAKIYEKLPEHYPIKKVDKLFFTDAESAELERIDYLKTIKLSKKDNMTPDNCYVCQLSQIPGVSVETANLIAQQPGLSTMRDMILTYEKLPDEKAKESYLADIMIKNRRLGPVLSKRIYEYLCPQAPSVPVQSIPLQKMKIKLKI